MSKNIIFYFSGTGNCLTIAQDIGKAIPDCEIVSMGFHENYRIETKYDRIGFVFPVYFQGLPSKVADFISTLNVLENKDSYYFCVTAYGNFPGIAGALTNQLLFQSNGVKLSYSAKLSTVTNYVVLFKISKKIDSTIKKANQNLKPIIINIKNESKNKIGSVIPILNSYYKLILTNVHGKDHNFRISNECISCGICKKVCPVGNIEMVGHKPQFLHQCEMCMSCLSLCPKQAINYKDITQTRGRYTHPNITYKELAQANKNKQNF